MIKEVGCSNFVCIPTYLSEKLADTAIEQCGGGIVFPVTYSIVCFIDQNNGDDAIFLWADVKVPTLRHTRSVVCKKNWKSLERVKFISVFCRKRITYASARWYNFTEYNASIFARNCARLERIQCRWKTNNDERARCAEKTEQGKILMKLSRQVLRFPPFSLQFLPWYVPIWFEHSYWNYLELVQQQWCVQYRKFSIKISSFAYQPPNIWILFIVVFSKHSLIYIMVKYSTNGLTLSVLTCITKITECN